MSSLHQVKSTPDGRLLQVTFEEGTEPVHYARYDATTQAVLNAKSTLHDFVCAVAETRNPLELHPQVNGVLSALLLGLINHMGSIMAPLSFAPTLGDVPEADLELRRRVAEIRDAALAQVLTTFLSLHSDTPIGQLIQIYADPAANTKIETQEGLLRSMCVDLQKAVADSQAQHAGVTH